MDDGLSVGKIKLEDVTIGHFRCLLKNDDDALVVENVMGTNREWIYGRLDGKHSNEEFIHKVSFQVYEKDGQVRYISSAHDDDYSSAGNGSNDFEMREDEDDPSLYDDNNKDIITNDDDMGKVQDKRRHTERELYQKSIYGLMESYHRPYLTPSRVSIMCTCLSNLPPEELQLWWRTFEIEGQCTWPPELTEEVKEGWLNRTEEPNAATLHCQGPISTLQLARRMIKEGKTPTPSALFARSHSKNDP
ncbi:LOW QUALITY PROTEIN: hypothetical protein Cgig2_010849 [Carnegiea gigantea]|uniref:Uncharacterized protein n=1 Tax=Carnegiea gigantea TaxID=171969 RepID=A0A9Q1K5H1_9CARY|nr:LOW QUALITY PROTEIN: hypothetical protein Cgig2_010849 [Carnegiea gigantea]